MFVGHTRTGLLYKLFKGAITEVAKYDPRTLVGVLWKCFFNVGIDVAGDQKNIRTAVIVEIHDARSPTDEASFHTDPRDPGYIFKICLAIVAVETVSVFGEVRLE